MSNEDFTVTISFMEERDTPQVAKLEKSVFSQPWSEKAFKDTIADDNYIYIVAKQGDFLLGYIGCIISTDEADITNIAVNADYRRLGIADKLIGQIVRLLKDRGVKKLFLEVRQSNLGARRLYENNGFEPIGIRRDFYRMPDEDALLMAKNLQ